jgi:hypothetical protein
MLIHVFLPMSGLEPRLSPLGQIEVALGRLLGLLDQSVQKHHASLENGEQDASYPLIKPRAHLPEIRREFAYHRHADRPTELHRLQIGANRELVGFGQRPQPLPNRFGPRLGAEENNI